MTFLEAKKHLARKLNIDYDDIANNDLWSDTDLGTLVQLGFEKAWDFKPWDFTEDIATGNTSGGTLAYPDTFRTGSVFLIRINGKEFKKISYMDYLKYLEDYPTATDRICAEFKKTFYFNTNAFTSGQAYELHGHTLAPVVAADAYILPFTAGSGSFEHSGNEAIVQLAYAEAMDSEKKKEPSQAEIERKKAYQTLDILWQPFADQIALQQSKGRPMFNVPDFIGTGNKNNSQNIGNFNYLN